MMYWGDHMSTGGWIFSVLATLIFLALIVALISWFLSATSTNTNANRGDDGSAQEILDRRLASGELTVEQYEQVLDTLTRNTPTEPPAAPSVPPGPQTPPRAAGTASG
jgi:uncharacterized membrane protein